jgi:hypothetical protein
MPVLVGWRCSKGVFPMLKNRCLGFALLFAVPMAARGQDASVPGATKVREPPGVKEARVVESMLTWYLNAVQGKRWTQSKQVVHPKTLAVIAQRKKRLGREEHPLAPWYYENTYYLKAYHIAGARYLGAAFVVDVLEDNYEVASKAVAQREPAAYLVGKFHGKWYVVDKKRGETFNEEAVKLGYPDYFDKLQFPREEEEEE